MVELSEQDLQDLYTWIDEIPLSRPKKNISRDFSDAGQSYPMKTSCPVNNSIHNSSLVLVMAAELVNYFFPRLVELHNYSMANSFNQKLDNWKLINS